MSTALVLGKFYPPHRGHLHLLGAALRENETVVVLCLGSVTDSFSPAARLAALVQDAAAAGLQVSRVIGRHGYDESPFDENDDAVWRAHLGVFAAHLRQGPTVDVVVTSEGYGEELAQRLGIRHELVDLSRAAAPMSSTRVRADPIQAWPHLGPGTRQMLATRVVLLGAESTGTTTVSRLMADRLRARGGPWALVRWVQEYGRTLTQDKQDRERELTGLRPLAVPWSVEDFADVARVQTEQEDDAAATGGPILVCDTDAFATPVWERRYLGDAAQLDPAGLGTADVYLLTDHEGVPFVQDGMRDGEHLRAAMTEDFTAALIAHQRPWALLTGTLEERIDLAVRIADQTMQRKLAFNPPI